MFAVGGAEILILLLFTVLVAVVLGVTLSGHRGRLVADETVVTGLSATDVDRALFPHLSAIPRLSTIDAQGSGATLTRAYIPTWCIVVAVIAFPIGLVCLLVRREHRIQVSLIEESGSCRIRVVGHAPTREIRAVAAAIQRAVPAHSVIA